MSASMVAYHNGSWACYQLEGRRPRFIGCSHRSPRSAIAHRANLDPYVSPLATPSEEPQVQRWVGTLRGAPLGGRETGGWTTGAGQRRASEAAAPSPDSEAASGMRNRRTRGSEAARLDLGTEAVSPSRVVPAVIAIATDGAPTPLRASSAMRSPVSAVPSPGAAVERIADVRINHVSTPARESR